jgi:chitinase
MYKYLDLVHVMCYDYNGKWDKKTGHNAPLYSRPQDTGKDVFLNVEATVKHLLKKGAIPEKTVLGVPFYGRAFKLENPHDSRMGARSRSTSFAGPYTREDGFLGYNEICEELTLEDTPWKVEWEQDIMAPYMHNGLKWVSFDNEKSIRKKSEFAFGQGLGGVMVWSIDTDDFTGSACGGPDFPLLRTINNALYRSEAGLVPGLTGQGRQGSYSTAMKSTSNPSFILILVTMCTTVAIALQKSIF